MNDKDRDLIAQILRAAGTAGEHGFAYLVYYSRIDGLTDMLGCATLVLFALWVFHRLLRWHPKDSDADIPRGYGLLVCALVIAGSIIGFWCGTTEVLAPEGAAIRTVLGH